MGSYCVVGVQREGRGEIHSRPLLSYACHVGYRTVDEAEVRDHGITLCSIIRVHTWTKNMHIYHLNRMI